MIEPARVGLRLATLAVTIMLGACAHLWPWGRAAAGPPPMVTELVAEAVEGGAGVSLPQTWNRNTLRVALNGVAGEGEVKLRPLEGHDWPIRLEFAVQPGAFAHLELRGEQRVILNVPTSGAMTLLPLPLGVIAPNTKMLTLRYGP